MSHQTTFKHFMKNVWQWKCTAPNDFPSIDKNFFYYYYNNNKGKNLKLTLLNIKTIECPMQLQQFPCLYNEQKSLSFERFYFNFSQNQTHFALRMRFFIYLKESLNKSSLWLNKFQDNFSNFARIIGHVLFAMLKILFSHFQLNFTTSTTQLFIFNIIFILNL